jgi:hypothetical protein
MGTGSRWFGEAPPESRTRVAVLTEVELLASLRRSERVERAGIGTVGDCATPYDGIRATVRRWSDIDDLIPGIGAVLKQNDLQEEVDLDVSVGQQEPFSAIADRR